MKRFSCLFLALVMVFAITACGKDTSQNDNDRKDSLTDTAPDAYPEKQEPKYDSKYLSATAIEKVMYAHYQDEENNHADSKLFGQINGLILDEHTVDFVCYFLTTTGLYRVGNRFFDCVKIDIDTGNNTKIVTVCNKGVIVLADDENNLSLYAPRCDGSTNEGEIIKWDIDEFKINDEDFVVGGSSLFLWDYIYIFSDVCTDGLRVSTFTYDKIYEEDAAFKYIGTYSIAYNKSLDSEVVKYIPSKGLDRAEGFLLLEDGELSYVMPNSSSWGDIVEESTMDIMYTLCTDAENAWALLRDDEIVVRKSGKDKSLFYYKLTETDSKYSSTEYELVLPDAVDINDIEDVIHLDDYLSTEFYIVLNNNDVYRHAYEGNWEFCEEVTNALKSSSTMKHFNFEGIPCFVFDDGYAYMLLNDLLIEEYT